MLAQDITSPSRLPEITSCPIDSSNFPQSPNPQSQPLSHTSASKSHLLICSITPSSIHPGDLFPLLLSLPHPSPPNPPLPPPLSSPPYLTTPFRHQEKTIGLTSSREHVAFPNFPRFEGGQRKRRPVWKRWLFSLGRNFEGYWFGGLKRWEAPSRLWDGGWLLNRGDGVIMAFYKWYIMI